MRSPGGSDTVVGTGCPKPAVEALTTSNSVGLMNLLSPAFAERVATRHGIVTVKELITDGSSRSVLRRLAREGLVVRIHDGVYRLATSPDAFEARWAGARAADSEAVVSGLTAARLWQWRSAPRVSEPIVLVVPLIARP